MELFRTLADLRLDVDRLVDRLGVALGDFVAAELDALRPGGRVAGQLRLWDNL
jgi:hypothetical protein